MLSHTYPQLYLLMDAKQEKSAVQQIGDNANQRPLSTDPIEDQIAYDAYQAAAFSGENPTETEKRIERNIKRFYEFKEREARGDVIESSEF